MAAAMKDERIRGVLAPVLTPFDRDLNPDPRLSLFKQTPQPIHRSLCKTSPRPR